jgi:uncharacterized protein YvpB
MMIPNVTILENKKTIKIKSLTHKMKNRVGNHGNIWTIDMESEGQVSIYPTPQKDHPRRYECWVTEGKDFEILEVIGDSSDN